MSDIRAPIVLAFFAVATLAGCARQQPVVALAAAPAPVVPPRPVLAVGNGAVTPPALAPDGQYRTINYGIGPLQTAWHLRAALNVAAIGCRSAADAALAPSYNAMLTSKKAVLADADHFVQTGFRKASPATWQADHDVYMTKLYNFFAMPGAKAAFCAAADAVAPQAATVASTEFVTFAATALPQLEAPFTAVYAAVDRYKIEVAAWDAQYGPDATRLAAAAPVPAAAAPAAALSVPGKPRLAYADLGPVLAWEPHRDQALALR